MGNKLDMDSVYRPVRFDEELPENAVTGYQLGRMASHWVKVTPPQPEEKEKEVEYGKCPECRTNIQIWNCSCGDGHPY